jgi:hypothetical protein
MVIQFGTGNAIFVPLAGNLAVPSSPRIPATIQDFNFDNTGTMKELRGQSQYPDDVAVSDKKATWKLGSGRFDIDLFNNLFAGETASTGGENIQIQEAHNVPASSTYTITVTHSANYETDMGVTYSATGQPLVRVNSVSAAGQYSVNQTSGIYTFYLGDAGVAMLISYAYTITTGNIVTVNNHVQGWAPTFEIYVATSYQELTSGVSNYLHIFNARCTKFGFPLKRSDYLVTDLEGECFAAPSGKIFELYQG